MDVCVARAKLEKDNGGEFVQVLGSGLIEILTRRIASTQSNKFQGTTASLKV